MSKIKKNALEEEQKKVGQQAAEQAGTGQVAEKAAKEKFTLSTESGKTISRVSVEPSGYVSGTLSGVNKGGDLFSMKMPQLPLSPEQYQEFQKISVEKGTNAALDYAAKAVWPYFINDKQFVEPVLSDGKQVEKVNIYEANMAAEGEKPKMKWMAAMNNGENDKKFALATEAEVMSSKKRVLYEWDPQAKRPVPALDEKGQVRPVRLAEIVEGAINRSQAVKQQESADYEKAKTIKWDGFKVPEGINITDISTRSFRDKADGHLVTHMSAKANGFNISTVLTGPEAQARLEKRAPDGQVIKPLATDSQVLVSNSAVKKQLNQIVEGPKARQQNTQRTQQHHGRGI